jgi:hypothetical protein
MSQRDTRHGCHICDMRHTCDKYHCHVSLVIQCVLRGLLGADFNKVRGGVGGVAKKWLQGLRRLLPKIVYFCRIDNSL